MSTWEARQDHTCDRCKGSGHDKGGTPLVKFEWRKTAKGKKKVHVTEKQGSGCLKCGGLGVC